MDWHCKGQALIDAARVTGLCVPRFVMSGCAGVDAAEQHLVTLNVGKWLAQKVATKHAQNLYIAPVVLHPYNGTDGATMVSFYNELCQVGGPGSCAAPQKLLNSCSAGPKHVCHCRTTWQQG